VLSPLVSPESQIIWIYLESGHTVERLVSGVTSCCVLVEHYTLLADLFTHRLTMLLTVGRCGGKVIKVAENMSG